MIDKARCRLKAGAAPRPTSARSVVPSNKQLPSPPVSLHACRHGRPRWVAFQGRRQPETAATPIGSGVLHPGTCIQSLIAPTMFIVTLPPAFDGLDPVIDRLVANYGDERRALVERAVIEAWQALQSIQNPLDRRVTAERLARIELHARTETGRRGTHADTVEDGQEAGLPVQRTQAQLSTRSHGMWAVEPARCD